MELHSAVDANANNNKNNKRATIPRDLLQTAEDFQEEIKRRLNSATIQSPRRNFSSTLYFQSFWCMIQGIHSL
jgi:hypothetical protein